MKTGAAVLCGGLSSRMGRDKALLPWRGRTLVEEIVSTVSRATEEVLVVTSRDFELPPLEARVIEDREPRLGPLGGIREALEASRAELIFISGTDTPFLTTDFVRHVLSYGVAAAPLVDGHVHALAAAYPTSLAATAGELIAEGRLRALDLLKEAGFRKILSEELPDLESLRGLNTPGAYLRAIAESGDQAPVIVELRGTAESKAGQESWETAPASLRDVLIRVQKRFPELVLWRDGRPAERLLLSLNGSQDVRNESMPLGPGDRLRICKAT